MQPVRTGIKMTVARYFLPLFFMHPHPIGTSIGGHRNVGDIRHPTPTSVILISEENMSD
jgi:hypothetical protein